MPSWDPRQYTAFEAERARPFGDLLGRVRVHAPRVIVDLGCGDGARTLELADRWPAACVVGVDSSPDMLAAARERDVPGRVRWVEADLADPQARRTVLDLAGFPAVDLVVAAASLQWVPDHTGVIGAWAQVVAPGGWFALQVPGNHDAPSHALMRDLARENVRAAELLPVLLDREGVLPATGYADLFAGLGWSVEAWETTYVHLLDPAGDRPDPVLDWVRGTGLRPVLDLLTDPGEREAFLTTYAARLREAYLRGPGGVAFPFRRMFAVAQAPGGEPSVGVAGLDHVQVACPPGGEDAMRGFY